MGIENKKSKIFIAVLLIIIIIMGVLVVALLTGDSKTAVIVEANNELMPNDSGKMRVSINPVINVEENTMQDIYCSNFNRDRLLKCKIYLDGKYIYESDYIEPNKTIKADVIDESYLIEGKTEAVAEIYSYDMDKNQLGQTNVSVTLIS